jgi:hypothetical protein
MAGSHLLVMNTKALSCCVLLAVAVGLSAGCASFESVKDRFTPAPPQTRVVQGEPRQVYDAARLAMEKLGYTFVGGGPAQGRLDGLSSIATGGSFGSAQQRSISIHVRPAEAGSVEVQVLIKETVESNADRSSGAATERSLRDPAAYGTFFVELARQLQGRKAD